MARIRPGSDESLERIWELVYALTAINDPLENKAHSIEAADAAVAPFLAKLRPAAAEEKRR